MHSAMTSAVSSLPPAAKLRKPNPTTAGNASARTWGWTPLAPSALLVAAKLSPYLGFFDRSKERPDPSCAATL